MAKDGSLYMLDKFNTLWQAQPASNSTAGSSSGFDDPQALAYLGPGRPLGHHFDAHGDLIICNSLQVSQHSCNQTTCRLHRYSELMFIMQPAAGLPCSDAMH